MMSFLILEGTMTLNQEGTSGLSDNMDAYVHDYTSPWE